MNVDSSLVQMLAAAAPEGIVICEARDGAWPVVFVNAAMEQLTGYDADSIRGRSLRFLQADDHDQEGLARIRSAFREGTVCQTTLRNYRRDGTLFCNEVSTVPLRDPQGRAPHFASFDREGGGRRQVPSSAIC